jgi:hypothetical protein
MTDIFKLIEDHGLTLHGDIEHFAELVRAEEREACWEIISIALLGADRELTKRVAAAIRARGER